MLCLVLQLILHHTLFEVDLDNLLILHHTLFEVHLLIDHTRSILILHHTLFEVDLDHDVGIDGVRAR